jgi:hypothetical protein
MLKLISNIFCKELKEPSGTILSNGPGDCSVEAQELLKT